MSYSPGDAKEERRMWCIQRAIEARNTVAGMDLIVLAKDIEKYIMGG